MKFFNFIFLILLSLTACGEDNNKNQEKRLQTVSIYTVGENKVSEERHFIGRVEPVSTVDLSFEVGGKILDMPLTEGSLVKKGSLLASLDATNFQLALRQAEASYEVVKLDFERKKELLPSNAVSKAVFDKSEAEYKLSQVALENARKNLSKTNLYAPFDALITRRLIEPQTNVGAGIPILRVQDVSEYRIKLSVQEELILQAHNQNDFEVVAIVANDRTKIYPLEYREHVAESTGFAQTYEVSFRMVKPKDLNLLPGMTVLVVAIPKNNIENSFFIPISSLDPQEDGHISVWVFNPETNIVSSRSITIGEIKNDKIEVLGGLSLGEQIVSAGAHLLREGLLVRPMN